MTDCATGSPAPFDAVEAAFRRACAPPRPLALNPRLLAPGLPDRMMPLDELRALLLHPSCGRIAGNAVWAELARRARRDGPDWSLGLTGVALPGLRRAAARLLPAPAADPDDLQAEVLTGFLEALAGLDLDGVGQVHLAGRLTWAAYRAGEKLAVAEAAWASARARPHAPEHQHGPAGDAAPAPPWSHPDLLLARAVAAGVLTPAQARLIGASRVDGIPLAQLAAAAGTSHSALCNKRKRAEKTLAAALAAGELPE